MPSEATLATGADKILFGGGRTGRVATGWVGQSCMAGGDTSFFWVPVPAFEEIPAAAIKTFRAMLARRHSAGSGAGDPRIFSNARQETNNR
jgi:hypothetical protein